MLNHSPVAVACRLVSPALALPSLLEWVFLVDLTIQLGTHKCLVILGVPLSQLRRTGYSPDHHDVHVLSLHVLTRCNGTIVSGHLSTVSKRVGVPVQIVSDHGSDVLAGIRLFRQKNRHVVETYDITHGLAILLKNQLEPDPCWTSFVKACQSTRQQLQQAVGISPTPGLAQQRAVPQFGESLGVGQRYVGLALWWRRRDLGGAAWSERSRDQTMA